jgi:hypothetical protein
MAKQPKIDPDALHREAQVAALAGLIRGDDVEDVLRAVAPTDAFRGFTPDVAILDLAVSALDLASPRAEEPLVYEGIREKYLPEVRFRGKFEHRGSQYALYAAACKRGGLEPDLLNDAGWWQNPRLWVYAVYALVIYTRAAADRTHVTVADIARIIAARHGLTTDVDTSLSASNLDTPPPA